MKLSLPPNLMLFFFIVLPSLNPNVFFSVFSKSHPTYDQTQGCGALFCLLYGQLYSHHKNRYKYFSSLFYVKFSFTSGKSLPQSKMAPFI
jgi:hypothetical protein